MKKIVSPVQLGVSFSLAPTINTRVYNGYYSWNYAKDVNKYGK